MYWEVDCFFKDVAIIIQNFFLFNSANLFCQELGRVVYYNTVLSIYINIEANKSNIDININSVFSFDDNRYSS